MLHRHRWAKHAGVDFDVWFALVTFGSEVPTIVPVRQGGRVIEVAHCGAWSFLRPQRRARLLASPWLRARKWLVRGYGQLQQWVPVDRPHALVTVCTRLR